MVTSVVQRRVGRGGHALALAWMMSLLCCVPRAPAQSTTGAVEFTTAIMQVAKHTIPAVVHLEVRERQEVTTLFVPFETAPLFQRFFGIPYGPHQFPRKGRGQGTGMLMDAAGRILTNEHVVRGATSIEVLLANGHTSTAHVVGTDPKTDLAVLTIDAQEALPAVIFGNSDTVEVGEWVVAIGQPRGLEHTVTQGIISAEHRRGLTDPSSYQDFLQTDAAINAGNSGGPLVNLHGEVIGVTTVIASHTAGVARRGFAIPSTMAVSVAHALIAHGTIERAWLGVRVYDVTPAVATSLGWHTPKGALIAEVVKGGPAEQAGLQQGDVVVAYQGHDMADADTLRNAVALTPIGHEAKLTIVRGGQPHELTATVRNLEEVTKTFLAAVQGRFGVTVRPVSPEEADKYGLECLSMPDFFHCLHDLVKSYALPIGQRLRHAHQELTKAKEAMARRPGPSQVDQPDPQAKVLVEARQVEVTRWEEAHNTYRGLLETLSLTLHPFRSSDSAPQNTAQVESQLQATVEAIEAFAQCHQLPARPDAMTKVRKQVPALAALVDFWWQGVHQD